MNLDEALAIYLVLKDKDGRSDLEDRVLAEACRMIYADAQFTLTRWASAITPLTSSASTP